MTHKSVGELVGKLNDIWGGKPIILTTNNIKFLRARLIDKKDVELN